MPRRRRRAAGQQPWPLVNYGPAQGQATEIADLATGAGKKLGGIIAVVVLLAVISPIAGVIIGLVTARDTFDDLSFAEPVDETTYLPGQEPGENGVNVLTEEGYDDLRACRRGGVGLDTGLQRDALPALRGGVGAGPGHGQALPELLLGRRTLVNNDIKSTSDEPRVDLGSVDPQVMITLLDEVRGRIEDPTSWYVSIDSIPTEGPRLAVYA